MPGPEFLTYEQVCVLHDTTIAQHGGNSGQVNSISIHSAIAAPQNYYAYDLDSPRNLTIKRATALAGCYWYHLSSNHGFLDGNKRTGYMAAKTFLMINGYTMKIPHDRAEKLSLDVAQGNLSREDLMLKIRPYVKEATAPRR